MDIAKLFEAVDAKVFTPELKESLETQFNEAVENKAKSIADERIEEEIDSLNEKSERHIDFLNEKAEEYVGKKYNEMVDSLDKYLDRIVEEFVKSAKDSLDESVKAEKADMIIEAFESMLVAGGVKVATIMEGKADVSVTNKLNESKEKINSLVEENIALKDENEKLLREGIVAEMKEGLTLLEAEKFVKLAELVEFTKDAAFAEKLETIKESVKGSVKKEKKDETLVEDKKPVSASYAHLL